MNPHNAPDIDPNAANYAHCRVEIMITQTPDEFFKWYIQQRLEDFLLGTLIVSPITHSQMLEGPEWGKTGCARRVYFKDKTEAIERIVTTDYPNSYEYQPWAFTSPLRIMSDYAKAKTSAVREGDQTRIIWDYAFHGKSRITLPMLKLIVSMDWKRNMIKAMDIIEKHLETHGSDTNLDEVPAIDTAA